LQLGERIKKNYYRKVLSKNFAKLSVTLRLNIFVINELLP